MIFYLLYGMQLIFFYLNVDIHFRLSLSFCDIYRDIKQSENTSYVYRRETERLVHVLEVWGMERKLVKSYSRSAADSNMAVPHLLRPYAVLMKTVQFLLFEYVK